MKQAKWNRLASTILSGAVAVSTALMLSAAGPAGGGGAGGGGGGGGGGAGSGGGHGGGGGAAPSGGGGAGGHASAPGAGNPASGGHSAPAEAPHTVSPAAGSTPSAEHVGPAAGNALPGSGGNTPSQGTSANGSTAKPTAAREGGHRVYNPYAPHGGQEHRNNNNNNSGNNRNYYGAVYGYPWYPFSYGWGNGWYSGYGTQYGYPDYNSNNNYPFTIPYAEYNNQESLAANPPNSEGGTGQMPAEGVPSTAVPSQSVTQNPYTQQTGQARAANSVDKSPAVIQANNTVAQAQSAFNAERERVLAALAQKPEYQAALSRRHAAATEVQSSTTQPAGTASSAAVATALNDKLEAGDEVTKMEAQAVATDPTASAAKAKFEQAVSDRDALRAQLNSQVQPQAR